MTERAQSHPWRRDRGEPRRRRPRRFVGLVVLAALGCFLYVQRTPLLTAAGGFLIKEDALEPAEIIVVLAGDGTGRRIMKAVDLVRQDFAPQILVTGPPGHYGHYECDLAIAFAVSQGAPEKIFEPLPMLVQSTKEEASAVDAELRRRGIKKAIVVTSNFHTRRARQIFREQGGGGMKYLMTASQDLTFDPDSWWQSRIGKKIFLLEALKTMNSWVEQD